MSKKKPTKPSKHDGTNKNEEGLTPAQESFVLHYCNMVRPNATQAAKDAGYSEATAGQLGYQLLQKPSIRSAIQAKLQERFDTLDITGDRILREIATIAFGNLKQVAKWSEGGFQLLDSDELSDEEANLLKSLSMSESESSSSEGSSSSHSISFGTFDKLKALELLAKNKKLLTDVVEHKDTGLADRLAKARKRKK